MHTIPRCRNCVIIANMAAEHLNQIALPDHCTALREEIAQLRAAAVIGDTRNRLWHVSADLMLVAGFDGVMSDINPAWTSMLGWTQRELIGHNWFDLIHPDDIQKTMGGAKSLSEGTSIWRFDGRYRHTNGSYRWIAWAAVPGEGCIHAVGRDFTAEQEQAAALRRSEEALRQSQKMEAVGQLTGGLAHDFNNLLISIGGSLELMHARLARSQSEDLGHYITTAQRAMKRAAALTDRLLAFSRQQTLNPRSTDINRLITGMEALICGTVGPEITVRVVKADGLWPTWIDANQLENALLNLCINARDAMHEGGQLTIETVNTSLPERMASEFNLPTGQYVALAVSDSGTGMTAAVIARAFDPFFTTKPIGRGTGLGLSMIYSFARESAGQAQIESEPGQGTTLRLYLPRYTGEVEEPRDADVPSDLGPVPRAALGETVLVVDDEITIREIVTELLEGLGYAAIVEADGAAGLAVVRSEARIDLLVTDIGLPGGMDGQQLVCAARQVRPDLKVLFITGYAGDAETSQSHVQAGTQMLIKPFAMEAFARRINDLIG
jgi:PAS domain S-box-containing protein